MSCPKCGAPVAKPEQRFCVRCGNLLAPPQDAPPPAAPEVPAPLPVAPSVDPAPPVPPADATIVAPWAAEPGADPTIAGSWQPVADETQAAPPAAPARPGWSPGQPAVSPSFPSAFPAPAFQPAVPPVPTPAVTLPPTRRRRGGLVALIAIGIVTALLAGGGTFLLLDHGDDNSSAEGTDAPDGDARDGGADAGGTDPGGEGDGGPGGDESTPPATEQPSDEPSESQTPRPEPTFQCWTGRKVTDRSKCPVEGPHGIKGMRWVFPDFDTEWSPCQRRRSDRPMYRRCIVQWTPGPIVELGFSSWQSAEAARANYTRASGTSPYRWRGMLRWDYSSASGLVKTAMVYPDAPWGVTVYANTVAERAAVLDQLDFRPVNELGGKRLR